MPKVTVTVKRGAHVDNRDANRSHHLQRKLLRVSIKKRADEPAKAGTEQARSRSDESTAAVADDVNKRGDQRGVHNRKNPPDSDRMRRIRAMRTIYNRQMPKLACNSCSFAQSCPQFMAGFECAFLPYLNSHGVETPEDLVSYMQDLVASNARRVQLAATFETLSGATPSLELSESMMMLFQQMDKLHDKMTQGNETSLTVETDDSSIIGKLFGGLGPLLAKTDEALNTPIETVPMMIKDMGPATVMDTRKMSQEVANDFARNELARDERGGDTTKQPTIIVT